MKKIIPLILSLSLLFITNAYGEEPLDVLKSAVDQVISRGRQLGDEDVIMSEGSNLIRCRETG